MKDYALFLLRVSIHASAREATKLQIINKSPQGFLSTPPHGRRRRPVYAPGLQQ